MAEDNTALIAAISASQVRRRRRRLGQFVEQLLGEEYDQKAMDYVYPEKTGRGRPVDSAIFYYPGLSDGIVVFGPLTVSDMLVKFFKESLPAVMPEAAKFKDLPPKQLASKALDTGMVVLFGKDGKLEQVMAKRGGQLQLPDGGSAVEDVFDEADSSLVYFPAPGSAAPALVRTADIVPELKWLVSAI